MKYQVDRLHGDLDELAKRVEQQFKQKFGEHDELFALIAELRAHIAALEARVEQLERGHERAVGD